jgi:hypothetical protein
MMEEKEMKQRIVFTALLMAVLLSSCSRFGEGESVGNGWLNLSFVKGSGLLTKTYLNLPDTSDFKLKISDAAGKIIYDGKYGDCPESLEVKSGSYTIRVVSSEFTKPAFNVPQFGDEQCIKVTGNTAYNVRLLCRQMNAGVRLSISPDFLDKCPDATLHLKSSAGKLLYSYSEKRTAYFLPGQVSLVCSTGGVDEILMVKDLEANDMLTIGVSVPASGRTSGMSLQIDTSRVWLSDECVIGSGKSGSDMYEALSVAEARESVGQSDVWVCGYIVGGDLTSASASFEKPFKSVTNILLGPRSSTKDRSVCMSVQLSAGEVRDALNLVDNPHMLGRRVCLCGDIVSAYYGLPGMKNLEMYELL